MKITTHRLLINEPDASLDFYQDVLGMTLVHKDQANRVSHYWFAFGAEEATLELVYDPDASFEIAHQPSKSEGYWKYSIAVDDLDATHNALIQKGVSIGTPFEIPGLAYLCHLKDPNGYCIELIQKTLPNRSKVPLGNPSLNLSTLRVKNARKSLDFYTSLGMHLVYTYRSEERNMTLYFLAGKHDYYELTKVSDYTFEEQIWQSPHTLLELQHLDKTEEDPNFSYRTGSQAGFLGLDIQCSLKDLKQIHQARVPSRRNINASSDIELMDPDGHTLTFKLAQSHTNN